MLLVFDKIFDRIRVNTVKLIGKSERTIKTRTVEMQDKGLICRENGKRNGKWKVLV